jgi:hypothetical protein
MIRIRFAGTATELDPGRFRSLGELFASWQASQNVRAIARTLELDGARYESPDPALFADIALAPGTTGEIEAVTARSIALSSLESAAEYTPRVRAASCETAQRYRSGRSDLGAPMLGELMDALTVLSGALGAAAAELGDQGGELAGIEVELDRCLAGLVVAHERCDWIDLADGLEFELTGLLDGWSQRIARIAPGPGASA